MQSIIEYAEEISNQIKKEYESNPRGELVARLKIALNREELVSVAYGESFLQGRTDLLPSLGVPNDVAKLIKTALSAIWAQETTHTTYLESLLKIIPLPDNSFTPVYNKLDKIFGTIQGKVLQMKVDNKTINRILGSLMITIGKPMITIGKHVITINKYTTDIPPFINELREVNFPEFCTLSASLEKTAIFGYIRILELFEILSPSNPEWIISAIFDDLIKIYKDESYHYDMFFTLANNLFISSNDTTNRRFDSKLSFNDCVQIFLAAKNTTPPKLFKSEYLTPTTRSPFDLTNIENDPLIKLLIEHIKSGSLIL